MDLVLLKILDVCCLFPPLAVIRSRELSFDRGGSERSCLISSSFLGLDVKSKQIGPNNSQQENNHGMALGALEGAGCGYELGIFSSRRDLPVYFEGHLYPWAFRNAPSL